MTVHAAKAKKDEAWRSHICRPWQKYGGDAGGNRLVEQQGDAHAVLTELRARASVRRAPTTRTTRPGADGIERQ